ncbi:MAG: hypothetical protein MJD61_02970 [Proteobacteria bacterium]|nr:hypothetical protein [Pseudomonadota bacterium]
MLTAKRTACLLSAALGLTLLPPAVSHAQSVRVVVRPFSGKGRVALRKAVVDVFSDRSSIRLVPNADAEKAARELGVRLHRKRGKIGAAGELELSAWIEGAIEGAKRNWQITVRVYNGLDGDKLDEATFQAKSLNGLSNILSQTLWNRLGASVELSSPPLRKLRRAPPPAPAPVATPAPAPPRKRARAAADDLSARPAIGFGTRTVVLPFRGPSNSVVHQSVVSALFSQPSVVLVPSKAVAAAAKSARADLASASGRGTVAQKLRVATFIAGEVEKDGKDYQARIRVLNASDGDQLDDAKFAAAGLDKVARQVQGRLWAELGDAIRLGRAPGAAPAGAHAAAGEHGGGDHGGDHGGGHHGIGVIDTLPAHATRDAGESPLEVVGGERKGIRAEGYWFPLRHLGSSFLGNLGADVRLRVHISTDQFSGPIGYQLGVRYRLPLGKHEIAAVAGLLYEPTEKTEDLPGVTNPEDMFPRQIGSYSYLRYGAEARFLVVGQLTLGLRGHLLTATTAQENVDPGHWAPNGGFDGEFYLAHPLGSRIELRFGVGLQHIDYGRVLLPGQDPDSATAADTEFATILAAMWSLDGIAGTAREGQSSGAGSHGGGHH